MAPKKKSEEAKEQVQEEKVVQKEETKAEPSPKKAKVADPAPEAKAKDAAQEAKEAKAAEAAKAAKEAKEAREAKAAEAAKVAKEAKEAREAAAAEEAREKEVDAAADKRQKVEAAKVGVNMADATMNVLPLVGGKMLTTLTEGNCQYLLAGARASVGLKGGRYMFEASVVEQLNPSGGSKWLVHLGFSLSKSSLFLSDAADNVCFDNEGHFIHGNNRKKVGQGFSAGHTVAVVLNLESSGPNANTVSLFKGGVRVSKPQPLPENLRGKTLYPTITYRSAVVETNFGPAAHAALPFTCRMVADAAADDVEVNSKAVRAGESAKECNVLFPVGMSEQGYFEWVDNFLVKNPSYVEISDRAIQAWAAKSGIQGAKDVAHQAGTKDSPTWENDGSIKRVLTRVASKLGRNFVIPELLANLQGEQRKAAIGKFKGSAFKKTTTVIMGEPSKDFKTKVHDNLLAEKTAKREAENKRKVAAAEQKQKAEAQKRKADLVRKNVQLKKEGKEPEVEAAEEAKLEVELDNSPIELTDEEKNMWYKKSARQDVAAEKLAKLYAKFSLPAKDEGFDEVTYGWQAEASCQKVLKDYMHNQKMTQRVEDLTPGEWFNAERTKFQKALGEWKKRQDEFKNPGLKKKYIEKKKAEGVEMVELVADDIDVFTVKDVSDLGNGEPLFAHFQHEDWALLSARVEFHLLIHAFKKDLNDSDRPSFTETHMPFYYRKYWKKDFQMNSFGVKTFEGFVKLIKDTLTVNDAKLLQTLKGDSEAQTSFVQLTEENRRERLRREEAGDETAKLKFPRGAPAGQKPHQQQQQQQQQQHGQKRPNVNPSNQGQKFARW